MRSLLLPPTAALAALALLAPPSAGAATGVPTAPGTCPNGEVDWRIEGRISCAPVLPRPDIATPPAVLMTVAWVEEASRRLPSAPPLPPGLRAALPRISEQAARASRAALGRLAGSVPARRYAARDRRGNALQLRPAVGGLPTREPRVGCPAPDGTVTLASKMWISGAQTLIGDGRAVSAGRVTGAGRAISAGRAVSAGRTTGRLDGTARAHVGIDRRLERVEVATTFELTRSAGYELPRRVNLELTRSAGRARIEATVSADQTLGRTAAAEIDGTPSVEVDAVGPGMDARARRALERRTAAAIAGDREIAGAVTALAAELRDRIRAAESRWSSGDCAAPAAGGPTTPTPGGPAVPGPTPTGPGQPGPTPTGPEQPGPTPAPVQLPERFEGTVASDYRFAPTTIRTFSGTATYVRSSLTLGPDGVTYAWYDLVAAQVSSARAVLGGTMDIGCRYVAHGAGGTIEAGDVEIHARPDGTAIYALHYDVAIPSNYLATDCPPGTEPASVRTEIPALLDSRRPGPVADAFRPVGAGFELKAEDVTDVAVSPASATATASWRLVPDRVPSRPVG